MNIKMLNIPLLTFFVHYLPLKTFEIIFFSLKSIDYQKKPCYTVDSNVRCEHMGGNVYMDETGANFQENVRYNILLSKAYQIRRNKSICVYLGGGEFVLSPDEVLKNLEKLGVKISRKTLYNYEKMQLIPEPRYRDSRTTDYPDETVAEAFASYHQIHENWKLPPMFAAGIRSNALEFEKSPSFIFFLARMLDNISQELPIEEVGSNLKDTNILDKRLLTLISAYTWFVDKTKVDAALKGITGIFVYEIDNDGNVIKEFIPGDKVEVRFKVSETYKKLMLETLQRSKIPSFFPF